MNAKEKLEAIQKFLQEIKLAQRIDEKQLEQPDWTNEQRAALEAMVGMRGVYIEKIEEILFHRSPNTQLGQPCTWNGVPYPSITEAAKAVGVTPRTMYERIVERGYSSDDDMIGRGANTGNPVVYKGKQYKSLTAAAEEYGVSPATMKTWIKKGREENYG